MRVALRMGSKLQAQKLSGLSLSLTKCLCQLHLVCLPAKSVKQHDAVQCSIVQCKIMRVNHHRFIWFSDSILLFFSCFWCCCMILLSCQRTRPQSCSGSEWPQSGHKRRWSCLGWVRSSLSWQEENENSLRTTCVQLPSCVQFAMVCHLPSGERPKTSKDYSGYSFYRILSRTGIWI